MEEFEERAPELDCSVLGQHTYHKALPNTHGAQQDTLITRLAHAVVIYPNFGCPAIISSDQSLELVLLINQELFDNYHQSEQGQLMANRINLQLRAVNWANRQSIKSDAFGQASSLADKHANSHQKMTWSEPVPAMLDQDLTLYTLDGQTRARLPLAQVKYYAQLGFRHAVTVAWPKPQLSNGFYSLVWFSMQQNEVKQGQNVVVEPQDIFLRQALEQASIDSQFAVSLEDAPLSFSPNLNQPLQSFHPLLVTDAPYLGLGHLTDLHLSSRQHAFQKVQSQVLPGIDEKTSPNIASRVLNTYESVSSLLKQMGEDDEIHCLALTGDFVDYACNLSGDCVKQQTSDVTQLWQNMQLKDDKQRQQSHVIGIDYRTIYSVLVDFMDTYHKPVMMVGGNHDAYEQPYGISPRYLTMKPNAGIPADHNLTYIEALLLFGPGYDSIIKEENFTKDMTKFFRHLFNPLSDWMFQYNKQVFVGLGWGYKEESVRNVANIHFTNGGYLPRADETIDAWQWRLLTTLPPVQYRVLLMHATVINYDNQMPLDQSNVKFEISMNCIWPKQNGAFDQGSFGLNKKSFFDYCIRQHNLTHVLSGHSHRSAVYQVSVEKNQRLVLLSTLSCQGKGYPIDENVNHKLRVGTRLIVTGSAGPIANQKDTGVFPYQDLTGPTGTKIVFGTDKDLITAVTAAVESSKPRLAAAFDYWQFSGEHQTPIKKISTKQQAIVLEIESAWPIKQQWWQHAILYHYRKGRWVTEPLVLTTLPGRKLSLNLNELGLERLQAIKVHVRAVLALCFHPNLQRNTPFSHYNSRDPWLVRVQSSWHREYGWLCEFNQESASMAFFRDQIGIANDATL